MSNVYNYYSKDLQTQNIRSGPVWLSARGLLNLAFVPTEHVISEFLELPGHMPQGTVLDNFVNYFMTTRIQGTATARGTRPACYPPATWNQVGRTIAGQTII